MKTPSSLYGLCIAASFLCQGAYAQLGSFTDPDTGITFSAQTITDAQTDGGFMWGWALPPDAATVDATEYIGIIVGAINEGGGWSGISHGGGMTSALLLTVWPNEEEIVSSFRFSTGYVLPDLYSGDATLSQISASVNETHYTLIYRCDGCFSWDHEGTTGSRSTSEGVLTIGWAQALDSPSDPSDPGSSVIQHDTQSLFGAPVESAVNEQYSEWASLAPTGTPTDTPTVTPTVTPTATGIPVPTDSFDYIVVGSGAGGIPVADRLSEAGNSVLLIEKGPPSSYRWGGTIQPGWLSETNLTRFDVPGLCNQIWVDSAGIACNDVDVMAGCVVGGGTAVNSGLWWKGPSRDWDENFPSGWKAGDMNPYVENVLSRIPWNDHPSMDGQLYLQQGYEIVAGALRDSNWVNVTANEESDSKQQFFSYTPFMFANGERGGPMATYLVSADERQNFNMWTNTAVRRVIRSGGHITGIEVEPFAEGGYQGIVNVTADTGRVILSAGTFGTSKILMRSGIGPQDMLEVVQGSAIDGDTMVDSAEWINLPVGYNLVDHVNTNLVVTHPDVVAYDFYAAYDDPIPEDRDAYLESRSGPLAMAAPNIGPMFWEAIPGSDGISRQLQWQARVEGSLGEESEYAITISQYLGTGSTSRGRLSITPGLSMTVSTLPYLIEEADVEAVISGIEHLQEILSNVPNLTFSSPAPDQSAEDYVNNYAMTTAARSANHWMGSNKMGVDDGREEDGTAVVDLDTKVYGTDNLFVVDAGVFPGMVTANPSAMIVAMAERAAERIMQLT